MSKTLQGCNQILIEFVKESIFISMFYRLFLRVILYESYNTKISLRRDVTVTLFSTSLPLVKLQSCCIMNIIDLSQISMHGYK